jgi:hypothetical protein
MSDSEKLAIAAHLHVLLRRKTGRVTDTQWMAVNAEYAAEIVRFARERAVEDGLEDLALWAERLEHALQESPPAPLRRPLLGALSPAVRQQPAPSPVVPPQDVPRYVGGIR